MAWRGRTGWSNFLILWDIVSFARKKGIPVGPGLWDRRALGSYVRRKQGAEPVPSLDSRADALLAETYGILVYQEQVLELAWRGRALVRRGRKVQA